MKRISSILWGIILILVSAVLILNALNITNIDIFFDGWWTLFIIVPSFVSLFNNQDRTGSIIGLLIGVFLLLACQNVLNFDMLWKLCLPVIIAYIGIKMIFKGIFGNRSAEIMKKFKENGETMKTAFAAFTGQNINFDDEVFTGCELTAVFGGIKCDLRNTVFESDVVINTCAIFGGVDILLPENVNLKVNATSLFGGVDDKKHQNFKGNCYTVYLNSTSIFGGVDVK
ncbi:MAG: LiaF transmembrane domain-containing protein [Clostridia bacterium]